MTTRKGFKRRARARMAKTGERYATARRTLLADGHGASPPTVSRSGTDQAAALGDGRQPISAALASVLARQGVRSPLTGEPLSEATLLGIGGGLGAGYILWEFKARDGAILTLGFSNQWQYPGIPGWYGKTLERLGMDADLHETAGPRGAREALDGILAGGSPVIAFVDTAEIGTWAQPASLSGYSGYPVVVTARLDDGSYLVDDRGRAPFRVSGEVMAAARARIVSFKHRLIRTRPDPAALTADRLRAAIAAGLEDQVDHLRSTSDSFSLPAWRKWARLMTDTRNGKAWPRVFSDGDGLFGALVSIVEGVDGDTGATGGHLRDLYAETLDEAAVALDRPGLADAAKGWRAAADLWEDLADAAIPPDLPGALDAIEAAEALHAAVMDGEPGRGRAAAAAGTLWSTRAEYATSFPLPSERIDALFSDLGERLGEIYDAERSALDRTAQAIGR